MTEQDKKEIKEIMIGVASELESNLKQYVDERIEKSEIKAANGFIEMGERIMTTEQRLRTEIHGVEERLDARIDHVENNLGRRIDGLVEGKIKFERER